MKVAIVGGGISGLATAAALEVRGCETVVIEAEARAGGKVRTEVDEGFLCEWGPTGFLDREPASRALCERLGLTDRLLTASPAAKDRFIMHEGALVAVPTSPPAFLRSPLLSRRGRLRVISEPFRAARRDGYDESVAEFGARRIGSEAVDTLLDPMVSGIFAGDVHRLSIASAFPRMVELEQKYGSLVRAMLAVARERKRSGTKGGGPAGPGGELMSFRAGMQEPVDALARRLGDRLITGAPAQAIQKQPGTHWVVHLAGGRRVEADRLVLAVPAPACAALLAPLDGTLAELVGGIPYANIAILLLGLRREHVAHPLGGFGLLIPRKEGRRALGMIWTSTLFPGRAPEGHVLIDARVGGATDPSAIDLDDDALEALVRKELGEQIGLRGPTAFRKVYRHQGGIPQYVVGHRERLSRIERELHHQPGLYLTGNAFRGVGFNDCVREAGTVADRIATST